MKYDIGLHPGATWRSTDFQIHTPRDPQWQGSPHLEGGDNAKEQARLDWALGFVDHCISLDISAIAVTDHHDFCFVKYVRAAIELRKAQEKLWLFPGVEVTCNDSVQCLLLFDQDSQEADWKRVFGGHLNNIDWPDDDAATNPQASIAGKNLDEFIRGVSADKPLSGRCIILPHGSRGGHKTIIRQGFNDRFAKLPFDGVYSDKPFSDFDNVTKEKIWGRIIEWGTRRRGIIPTGDNRNQNFQMIGKNVCWVRLGEPTVESIRQALLADTARISYEPPVLPNHRITDLLISSSLTGPDFHLVINDGFNALIGGRGSGKSSVLEYLRFGLGRSAADTSSESFGTRTRDQQLVADTMQGGFVEVTLERNGIREIWRRTGDQKDIIEITVAGGETEHLPIGAAQQRFRARAFYQKQLSSLVSESDTTVDQVTGIAAAESLDRRREIAKEIAASKRLVKEAFRKVVEFWLAEEEARQAKAVVLDIARRLDALQVTLKESGLDAAIKEILEAAPKYANTAALLGESEVELERSRDTIKSLKKPRYSESLEQVRAYVTEFPELGDLLAFNEKANLAIEKAIDDALSALDALAEKKLEVAKKFFGRKAIFDIEHQSALEKQAHMRGLLDQIEALTASLQQSRIHERRTNERLSDLADSLGVLQKRRDELAGKLREETAVLTEAASKIEAMSGGFLRASVLTETTPKQYVEVLLSIFENSRVRDLPTRCDDRAKCQSIEERDLSWEAVVNNLMKVFKHKTQTGTVLVEASDEIAVLLQDNMLGSLTIQQVNSIYERLTEDMIASSIVATKNDFISFEYRDRDTFIPFDKASPGQQASALLQLLLNQEAGTLIIDQPEDDLDNRVVMDVADLLHSAKRKRQIIFATHNANFVVNGDADKVVSLAPSHTEGEILPALGARVRIAVDGAIETEAVRKAITETMEGGEKAFELRSRKYSFELPVV